jgi:hypothetical protein
MLEAKIMLLPDVILNVYKRNISDNYINREQGTVKE